MQTLEGDRRRGVRFEIVGRLTGSLESVERLPVVNFSRGGVCVRSERPLLIESTSAARLVLDGHVFDLHVRVRHVHVAQAGEAGDGYLLGLEFMGVAPGVLDEIERSQTDPREASDSAPSDTRS